VAPCANGIASVFHETSESGRVTAVALETLAVHHWFMHIVAKKIFFTVAAEANFWHFVD
jgi:hypothetical protein